MGCGPSKTAQEPSGAGAGAKVEAGKPPLAPKPQKQATVKGQPLPECQKDSTSTVNSTTDTGVSTSRYSAASYA